MHLDAEKFPPCPPSDHDTFPDGTEGEALTSVTYAVSFTVLPGDTLAALEETVVVVRSTSGGPLTAGTTCVGRASALPTPTKAKDSATRSRAAAAKNRALAIGR